MPEHSDRLQSVPAWTALPESRAQSTSSRASSQDMQEDELADAPGPSSPTRPHGGHKRKDGGIHRPHDSASKKRKLNERVTVLSGNDDDLPASAHALPVRRPPNAIPTRLHPPVYKAPNAAHLLAGKRSFEERYGPIPSPSAHQHASSITERPVARKSAAISQPGRRSNKTSQVFSSKQNPISRSATASPRKNKNRAGLRSSTDNARKPEPKSTKNKTPQTQRTGREIIEISDSDEEPARPVRLSSPSSQGVMLSNDVVELTDSDSEPAKSTRPHISESGTRTSSPIIISSSDTEASASVPSVHSRRPPGEGDQPHSSASNNSGIDDSLAPHGEASSSASVAMDHENGFGSDIAEYSLPRLPSPVVEPSGAPLFLPASPRSELPVCSDGPSTTIDNEDGAPDFITSNRESHTPDLIGDTSSSFYLSSVPAHVSPVNEHAQDRSAPSAIKAPQTPRSGGVEMLVPALDEMDLTSANVSTTSGSPMNYDADATETHTLHTDGERETPLDESSHTAVFARLQTPPRPSNMIDLISVANASSKKKRSSRTSLKYTPTVRSPASLSPSTANICTVSPTRATESPLSPSIGSQQGTTMSAEVRGHLYGGNGGFFKAVFKSMSPNDSRRVQSSQEAPAANQEFPAPLQGQHEYSSPSASVEGSPARLIHEGTPSSEPTSFEPILQPRADQDPPAVPVGTGPPKKPPLPIPRNYRDKTAQVQPKHSNDEKNLIDLTLDDSEPENEPRPAELGSSPRNSVVPAHPSTICHTGPLQNEDVRMISRSASPDPPLASASATAQEDLQNEAESISMRLSTSFSVTHGSYQGDVVDDDDEAVRDLLLESGRSSPDPIDSWQGQRRSTRSTRITRSTATRSNSSSSDLAPSPDPPASIWTSRLEPHVQLLRVDSGITRALVRRMSEVEFSSGEEDDGMSWVTHGKVIMREYANVCLRARDIPHRIQDFMNTLSPLMKQTPEYERNIFKAIIRRNTADVEPHAPEIDIINEVDNESCPSLEFYYTNYMWHSDSVPSLDTSQLKGCGCYPVCLPDSSCSCLKRQQEFYDENMSGFNYSRGHLRYEEYPVFECNALCGCEDDCRNRVVQHGRKHAINIEKTREKGWGVFAGERIPARTFVGIYSGEFITDVEGETRGKIYHLGDRTYLFDIDFWHLKKGKVNWEVKYCIDAFHVGNFTRYLNHSCEPNCILVPVYINEPDLEKPMLAIFTSRDVQAHQELCFSYFGSPDDGEEQSEPHMEDAIFIPCKCGSRKCTGRIWR